MEIWSKHRNVLGKGNANEDVQVEVKKFLENFKMDIQREMLT